MQSLKPTYSLFSEDEQVMFVTVCSQSLCCVSVSDKKWTELDAAQHRAHAMRLLDSLEVIAREKRLKVARAILYMAQGQCKSLYVYYKLY